jgi:tRNA dimethylallyltransferase
VVDGTPASKLAGDPGFAYPLVVIVGPTASGKTSLALKLAEQFDGEIVSCDAVAVYRGLDVGSAKPTTAERTRVPHHAIDILNADEPSTAGDYARAARAALSDIKVRGRLPIVTGGTGLYLRALLEGLAPAPPRDEALRERLRKRAAQHGTEYLHRLLKRVDSAAAAAIHPNDVPKMVRSIEVTLAGRQPQSEQWQVRRDRLEGFRVLQMGLNPPRVALYARIDERAARMFDEGLLEETAVARERYGDACRALGSLGYAQAVAVLRGEMTRAEAIAAAQQGHRNYAKRQMTWFRRDKQIEWLAGFGDDADVQACAAEMVRQHVAG